MSEDGHDAEWRETVTTTLDCVSSHVLGMCHSVGRMTHGDLSRALMDFEPGPDEFEMKELERLEVFVAGAAEMVKDMVEQVKKRLGQI